MRHPCSQDCEKRSPDCRLSCAAYQEYLDRYMQAQEAKRADRMIADYIDRAVFMNRRRLGKDRKRRQL